MITRNAARVALGAAGIVLAAAGFWAGRSLSTATPTPTVQTGTVKLVSMNGGFAIRLSGQRQATGYSLPNNVFWRDAYGIWQDGKPPSCMAPLSHGQRITIGVINAAPVADAPGGSVVVWLECPTRPIPHYPIVSPSTR